VKLRYDEATERFRAELRGWLAANQPSPEEVRRDPSLSSAHLPDWARAWQRRLFDAGWLVPGWPPELGGRGATPVQQLVYFEEMARVPVLRSSNLQGLTIIAPSIRDFGTPEQVAAYVLPTLRAEISWCLGMSEPGAGSDLAGLSTRAERRGDRYLVTGQKVWTSGAPHADYCFCFVRTDPEAPKHRGISVLVIDMRSPGIDVRPMPDLFGPEHADFSEVFLDGVEVPVANRVGEENQGWSMASGSLAHERGMLWTMQAARLEMQIEALRELAREPRPGGGRIGDDPAFRDRVAALFVDVQALKFMGYQGFARFARGEAAPEHSVLKLFGSETEQRLCLAALEAQGAEGLDVEFAGWGRGVDAPWARRYLISFTNTIAGGTSEIQRNIIATRVLGLPRDRAAQRRTKLPPSSL
jgi:alkylation response protein AidB-like acyl-CoA dehydrogenase